MESQTVSEQFEWEVRRVVAAFGVTQWRTVTLAMNPAVAVAGLNFDCEGVRVSVDIPSTEFQYVSIGYGHTPDDPNGDSKSEFGRFKQEENDEFWTYHIVPEPEFDEHMVKGLYRLGVEDEVLSQYNYPLSSQKKLELRLSMPRQYWPQKWIDEESV